jgi:RimJ/RimL family protein N-acetyltransferase
MGSEKGEAGMPAPPFDFLGQKPEPLQEPVMTRLEDVFDAAQRTCSVPVLETARLTLRAPCREDLKALAVLANDRRIAANTARIPHPYEVADAEQFIARANKHDGEACFVITFGDTLIGACGIDPREEGPELGYWVGTAYWGHGFATEAARALIDHAFGHLEHEALQAGARVSNPASRRVLEKCAFQWTGVRLTRIRAINSAAPVDRFRLDRKLWTSLKAWRRALQVV